MSKIKTYGEIQYYLHDADKKAKKVSRDSFMNSKGVSVKHNSSKPKQKTTTSTTGKVIENFNSFVNEYNGANLSPNLNQEVDPETNQMTAFDGGDGPSATKKSDKFKATIKKSRKFRGSEVEKEQDNRNKKNKEHSKEYRIAKNMDYQTTDDITRFAPRRQPTTNAGGVATGN